MRKKILFSSQVDCCVHLLLRHNYYYDIVKFQIDLEILASSKNFDKRLHNWKCFFFFFSRDFVLAFSKLFCRIILYMRRRDFFGQRESRVGERKQKAYSG